MHGLNTELDEFSILHRGGCGARVVQPLAVVRWPGRWCEDAEQRAKIWCEVGCLLRGGGKGCAWLSQPAAPASAVSQPLTLVFQL